MTASAVQQVRQATTREARRASIWHARDDHAGVGAPQQVRSWRGLVLYSDEGLGGGPGLMLVCEEHSWNRAMRPSSKSRSCSMSAARIASSQPSHGRPLAKPAHVLSGLALGSRPRLNFWAIPPRAECSPSPNAAMVRRVCSKSAPPPRRAPTLHKPSTSHGVTTKGLLVARRMSVLAVYRWNSYLPGGWF